MGENDIYRIRPEHTHGGGLQICDDGSDGTVQKLGFLRPLYRGQMQIRLSLKTRRNLRK